MASKPLAAESGLRIVLMGKTGNGKSTAGNTILGDKVFKVDISASSVTTKCSTETRERNGQALTVVDTPGLFHTSMDKVKTMKEIVGIIEPTVPGPHVFLWMVNPEFFTGEDIKAMKIHKKLFPSAGEFTIVLFTRGDKGKVENLIDHESELNKFIKWSNDQYHVFDNTQGQVEDLVKKISEIKQKKGFYQSELIQQADKAIKELKNQPQEQPAGVLMEKTSRLEKAIDGATEILYDKFPALKTFLEKLQGLAEAMIEF